MERIILKLELQVTFWRSNISVIIRFYNQESQLIVWFIVNKRQKRLFQTKDKDS